MPRNCAEPETEGHAAIAGPGCVPHLDWSWPRLQVKCGDREVDKRVEEKINQFYTWLDRHPGKRGQVDTTAIHNSFEWPVMPMAARMRLDALATSSGLPCRPAGVTTVLRKAQEGCQLVWEAGGGASLLGAVVRAVAFVPSTWGPGL